MNIFCYNILISFFYPIIFLLGLLRLILKKENYLSFRQKFFANHDYSKFQKINIQAVTSPEGPLAPPPEVKRSGQQATAPVRSAIPNVAPAFSGTPASNIDPTNPIVNPNPVDQALAQRLAGTSAISPRPPS